VKSKVKTHSSQISKNNMRYSYEVPFFTPNHFEKED